MASNTAELLVNVVLNDKGVQSGLSSLQDSLQRIGEFAVGSLLAKGFEELASAITGAAKTAIDAVGDWERLDMTLTNMTANEIYMAATEKKLVNGHQELVQVTKDGTKTLKDNTVAIQKQKNTVESAELALRNAELALSKFHDTAKGKAGEGQQFQILQNNVEKARNSLENAQIQLKNLQDTSVRSEMVTVFDELTVHTKTWGQAMAEATPQVQELLQWVTKVGVESPFTEESVTKVLRLGMSFGVPLDMAKKLTQAIVDWGAASGRTNPEIERLSRALGEVYGKGKLTGEEVRQLVNNGMSMTQIAAAMGMNMNEFTEAQRAGKIAADDLIKAFIEMSNERFAGAAKKLAFTWAGLVPTLKEIGRISLRDALYAPLKELEPVLGNIINVWQSFRPSLQSMGQQMKGTFKSASDFGTKLINALLPIPPEAQAAADAMGGMDFMILSVTDRLANFLVVLGLSEDDAKKMAKELGAMKDAASKLMDKIRPLIREGINKLSEGVKFLVIHWRELMSAFKGIGVLVGVSAAFKEIITLVQLITSPVTLLAVAAAALGVAWDKNWGGIRDIVKSVWTELSPILGTIWDWVQNKILNGISNLRTEWDKHWPGIKDAVVNAWSGMKDKFETLKKFVSEDIPAAVANLRKIWDEHWPAIQKTLDESWSKLSGSLGLIKKWFTDNKDLINPWADSLTRAFSTAGPILATIADSLLTILLKIGAFFLTEGPKVIESFAKTLEENKPKIEKFFQDLANLPEFVRDNWKELVTILAGLGGAIAGLKMADAAASFAMFMSRLTSWAKWMVPIAVGLTTLTPIIAAFAAAWALNLGNIQQGIPAFLNSMGQVSGSLSNVIMVMSTFAGLGLGAMITKSLSTSTLVSGAGSFLGAVGLILGGLGQLRGGLQAGFAHPRTSPAALFGGVPTLLQTTGTQMGAAVKQFQINMNTYRAAVAAGLNTTPMLVQIGKELGRLGTKFRAIAMTTPVLAPVINAVSGAFTGLGGAVAGVPGLLTLVLNPITLIIGALFALGAAYATNFLGFRDAVNNTVAWVSGKLNELGAILSRFWETSGIKSIFEPMFNDIKAKLGGAWEEIKKAFSGAGDTLKTAFAGLWESIQKLVKALEPLLPVAQVIGAILGVALGAVLIALGIIITGLIDVVARLISLLATGLASAVTGAAAIIAGVVDLISGVVTLASDIITTLINIVKAVFTGDWNTALESAKKVGQDFVDITQKGFTLVGTAIERLLTLVGDIIVKFLSLIGIDVSGWWKDVKKAIEGFDLGKALADIVSKLPDLMGKVGGDLIAGLVKGINQALTDLPKFISGVVDSFIKNFSSGLGVASPSTVFEQIGKDVIQGLINGIGALLGELGNIGQKVLDAIKGIFGGGEKKDKVATPELKLPDAAELQKAWDETWTHCTSMASTSITVIQSAIDTFHGNWVTKWTAVKDFLEATFWPPIKVLLQELDRWLRNTLVSALQSLLTQATTTFTGMLLWANSQLVPLIALLQQVQQWVQGVQTAFQALFDYLATATVDMNILNMIGTALKGLEDEAGRAKRAIEAAIQAASGLAGITLPTGPGYTAVPPASGGGGTSGDGGGTSGGGGGSTGGGNNAGTGKNQNYASGTAFAPGGWAMVGERGPELVNLPRGSAVYPHGIYPGQPVIQVFATVKEPMDYEYLAYRVATILNRRSK